MKQPVLHCSISAFFSSPFIPDVETFKTEWTIQRFDWSQLIMLRNLLSSARAVSIEFMSPMAMLPIPAGTDARVTELRGVVRREEFWDRLCKRPGLRVPDIRLEWSPSSNIVSKSIWACSTPPDPLVEESAVLLETKLTPGEAMLAAAATLLGGAWVAQGDIGASKETEDGSNI